MLLRLCLLVVSLCIAGCAGPTIATDYQGPDGGTVIVGLGTADGAFQNHWMYFRSKSDVADPSKPRGSFGYQIRKFFAGQPPDYETDDEKGIVIVATLPAGDYEANGFGEFFNGGLVQTSFSTKVPFSIPFSVRRGAVAYLGNFQATSYKDRNLLGIPVLAGAFYTVEDRMQADLAIAIRKGLRLPAAGVVDFTPDPAVLRHPLIVTPAERDRAHANERGLSRAALGPRAGSMSRSALRVRARARKPGSTCRSPRRCERGSPARDLPHDLTSSARPWHAAEWRATSKPAAACPTP